MYSLYPTLLIYPMKTFSPIILNERLSDFLHFCLPVNMSDNRKPKTRIGRLVKKGQLTLDEILNAKVIIKEPEIVDFLLPNGLSVEVLKTTSIGDGQYRRKAWVAVGNSDGLLGLGVRCARNNSEAIAGATKNVKLSLSRLEFTANRSPKRLVIGKAGNIEISIEPWILRIDARPLPRTILLLAGFQAALVSSNTNRDSGLFVEAMFDALRQLSL